VSHSDNRLSPQFGKRKVTAVTSDEVTRVISRMAVVPKALMPDTSDWSSGCRNQGLRTQNLRTQDLRNQDLGKKHLIHIAPLPALSRLERTHDRMFALMEVLSGVLVLRGIAAAYVTTDEAFPQMYPGIAHLETFLAAFTTGSDFLDFLDMWTGCLYFGHAAPRISNKLLWMLL
jgi:hypothetical protein